MPRASWKGSLRLSLVSCPVYLSPATTRTKSVRLHQVWVPRNEPQDEPGDADPEDEQLPPSGRAQAPEERARAGAGGEPEDAGPATRIALRPHDPYTGEEIEREEVIKGYEYERGQFVTLRADELKALDVESSRTIDLTTFIPRADVDPLFFSTPYYVYPDGPVAVEPYRVINAAMAEGGLAGLGRLTLSRRERMVMIEPREPGMVLVTLRSNEEVRSAEFGHYDGALDAEAVAIAAMIIKRKGGTFDPTTFRDRYQDALRELIEAKMRGLPVKAAAAYQSGPVLDLMAALKRSLAQETGAPTAKTRRKVPASDRRQRNLLLPVSGKGERHQPATTTAARRRKA